MYTLDRYMPFQELHRFFWIACNGSSTVHDARYAFHNVKLSLFATKPIQQLYVQLDRDPAVLYRWLGELSRLGYCKASAPAT